RSSAALRHAGGVLQRPSGSSARSVGRGPPSLPPPVCARGLPPPRPQGAASIPRRHC
ncbi:unnamed protein product, partial [Ectocarpus sp. 12 AP-2014]